MAEQLLDQARDIFEGQIDFEGQKLVELLVNISLTLVGAIAFLVGYFLQDIKLAVYIGLAGTAATFLLVVPPWPIYNKNPVKWLPVAGVASPANIVIDETMLR
ncbi:microsomal signal peptidase 12 kDa subunit-domain-containing protein [Apiosordaria backusii]|uniref:Signal peptidase complex subunit 1 n=1 Tax=Apiosordaria backusii TaxID=314023 RepID=A0AA40EZV7_9PEZI|nr:microsomal signal peptidase 12 kDa subunit-domain-containing protein [Apiosordaria backusii]